MTSREALTETGHLIESRERSGHATTRFHGIAAVGLEHPHAHSTSLGMLFHEGDSVV